MPMIHKGFIEPPQTPRQPIPTPASISPRETPATQSPPNPHRVPSPHHPSAASGKSYRHIFLLLILVHEPDRPPPRPPRLPARTHRRRRHAAVAAGDRGPL